MLTGMSASYGSRFPPRVAIALFALLVAALVSGCPDDPRPDVSLDATMDAGG